jgi:hypothetical protein
MQQACHCSSRFDTSESGSKESTQKKAAILVSQAQGGEETSRTDQQVDRRAREHKETDTWKYYDAMPSPWTLPYLSLVSLSSLFGRGSLELRAVRAHTYAS